MRIGWWWRRFWVAVPGDGNWIDAALGGLFVGRGASFLW